MTLSEELQWRGFVNQTTLSDIADLDGEPISFYWGVDPSASSMQIGNLAGAMMVRHMIDYGHKAYLLVGGATGMIGDPDGKKDERNLKTIEDIEHNKHAIAAEYRTVFTDKDFMIVDNYDWFKNMNYIDFLRTVGKHVPLSQMLGRDFVQARIGKEGSGISYAEFSYSLIQGYDFLHLYKEHGVTLQVCGADQWGNSIAGVDLIRRTEAAETHVLSMPLIINKTTGVKFGKSEGGAVWLDSEQTSAYKFYQFWLNVDDKGVIDYMKIYTLLSRDEIEAIAENHKINPGARSAQRRLAQEVTTLVHGRERCESVMRVTEVLFGDAEFSSLSESDLDALAKEIPNIKRVPTSVTGQDADASTTVARALHAAGVVSSLGEARRLIQNGAISVNGDKMMTDEIIQSQCIIKKGKNTFTLVR